MGKFVRQPPEIFDDALVVVGGEVDEYHIFLGFYGDALDANAVTAALGRLPTSTAIKGDIVHKNGRTRVEKTGKWLLRVDAKPGESLVPLVEAFFGSLTPDLAVWGELTKSYKYRFTVSTWIRSWNRGLEIPPNILTQITDRNLSLGIDIYVDYEAGEAH